MLIPRFSRCAQISVDGATASLMHNGPCIFKLPSPDAAVGGALKANYFCHCNGLPLNLVEICDGFTGERRVPGPGPCVATYCATLSCWLCAP